MAASAVILTYHQIADGPPPLHVDAGLFRRHLDCIQECGARVMTVAELAAALRDGCLPPRAVAITFDDGAASAARVAAPLLAERGLTATLFCVAGYLGRTGRWPTLPAGAGAFELAAASELAELAGAGFEIGSHGVEHAPLHRASRAALAHEVVRSKELLEAATGAAVTSFAYPYGLLPPPRQRALVRAAYTAACGGSLRRLDHRADPVALPRVDVHYVRRPRLLRRLLEGSAGGYLAARRVAARARRVVRPDFAPAGPGQEPKTEGVR